MVNTKKAYIEKAQAKLNELNAKKDQAIADAKIETGDTINKLEAQIQKAKAHLDEISDIAEDKWEEVKDKVESITDDVKKSIKKLFS